MSAFSDPTIRKRVRSMFRDGLSSREMAAVLPLSPRYLRTIQADMGLHGILKHPRQRKIAAERAKAFLARKGLSSLSEQRRIAHRAFAAAHGWPSDLPPRAVHVLDALYQFGPMTRREIAETIGCKPALRAGTGTWNAIMPQLIRRKLIVVQPKRRKPWVYCLTPIVAMERTSANLG